MKFLKLINAKMPTIVGILAFINVINRTSLEFESKKNLYFQHFSFYEVDISCSAKLSMKKFITSEPGLVLLTIFRYV